MRKDAKLPNAYITVVDTSTAKTVGEIKIDSNDLWKAVWPYETSGPRLYVVIRGNNSIEVFRPHQAHLKCDLVDCNRGQEAYRHSI